MANNERVIKSERVKKSERAKKNERVKKFSIHLVHLLCTGRARAVDGPVHAVNPGM